LLDDKISVQKEKTNLFTTRFSPNKRDDAVRPEEADNLLCPQLSLLTADFENQPSAVWL